MTRRRLNRPEQRPAPALDRHWAVAVVRAAYRLSGDAKLLFGLMLELDRPERDGVGGCRMSAPELARQLGKGADHTSDLRTHLAKLGLVHRVDVAGVREAFWFLRLPELCSGSPPKGASPEEKRRWVRAAADALDAHIDSVEATAASPVLRARERATERRTSPQSRVTQRRTPPPDDGELRPPAVQLDGELSEPQRQTSPVPEHEIPADSLPSVTLKAVSQEVSHSAPLPESHTDRERSEGVAQDQRLPVDDGTRRAMAKWEARRRGKQGSE